MALLTITKTSAGIQIAGSSKSIIGNAANLKCTVNVENNQASFYNGSDQMAAPLSQIEINGGVITDPEAFANAFQSLVASTGSAGGSGGSSDFADITGDPASNTALVAFIDDKISDIPPPIIGFSDIQGAAEDNQSLVSYVADQIAESGGGSDPNALKTDGTNRMTGPLKIDDAVYIEFSDPDNNEIYLDISPSSIQFIGGSDEAESKSFDISAEGRLEINSATDILVSTGDGYEFQNTDEKRFVSLNDSRRILHVDSSFQNSTKAFDGSIDRPYPNLTTELIEENGSDITYLFHPGAYNSFVVDNVDRVSFTALDSAYNQSRVEIGGEFRVGVSASHIGIMGIQFAGSLVNESNDGNIYIDCCEFGDTITITSRAYCCIKNCVLNGLSVATTDRTTSVTVEVLDCVDEGSGSGETNRWYVDLPPDATALFQRCRGFIFEWLNGTAILTDCYFGADTSTRPISIIAASTETEGSLIIKHGSTQQITGGYGILSVTGTNLNIEASTLDVGQSMILKIPNKYFQPNAAGTSLENITVEEIDALYSTYVATHAEPYTSYVATFRVTRFSVNEDTITFEYNFATTDFSENKVTYYEVLISAVRGGGIATPVRSKTFTFTPDA